MKEWWQRPLSTILPVAVLRRNLRPCVGAWLPLSTVTASPPHTAHLEGGGWRGCCPIPVPSAPAGQAAGEQTLGRGWRSLTAEDRAARSAGTTHLWAVRWGRRNVSLDLGCITPDLRAERDLTHGMQCFQSLRKVWAHDWTSKHHSQNDPLPKTPRPLLSSRPVAMTPGCKGGHCLHSNYHTDPWGWGQHLPAENASGAEGQLTPILPWEFSESSLNLGKLIHMPSSGPAKYVQVSF